MLYKRLNAMQTSMSALPFTLVVFVALLAGCESAPVNWSYSSMEVDEEMGASLPEALKINNMRAADKKEDRLRNEGVSYSPGRNTMGLKTYDPSEGDYNLHTGEKYKKATIQTPDPLPPLPKPY